MRDRAFKIAESQNEIAYLRQRLEEAEETLRAIRDGEVDAVIVADETTPTILTLSDANSPYRLLVDQSHAPTALISEEGRILRYNPGFDRRLSFKTKNMVGAYLKEAVDPGSAAQLNALIREGSKQISEIELLLVNANGDRIPAFLSAQPLHEGPAGLCILITDNTEQKHNERIATEEILAQSILEQIGDMVVVCDNSGKIVRASNAVEDKLGVNPLLQHFEEIFHLYRIAGDEGLKLTLNDILDEKNISGMDVIFDDKRHERMYLLLSAGSLKGADGDTRGTIITLIDITERKRVEAALFLADRRKDEFLAILAHELRNPLAPIRNALHILHSSKADRQMRERARDMMERQVDQMVHLVDDLLDVARITRGTIELQRERVLLKDVIDSAVETSQPLIEKFNHTLFLEVPAQPIYVNADPTRLAQAFLNLLNNAAKYSRPGGRIDLKVGTMNDTVSISITDAGIGIAQDMLPKIFEMFAQVDNSLERKQGGLGVGLTLVKNLVEMHGGSVDALSEGLGKGSTFTVTLPIANEQNASNAVKDDASDRPETSSTLRVLIVDDNEDSAKTLAWATELMGHEPLMAHNGMDAIEAAKKFKPHVALLDIGLPGMNGYELCREMRTLPEMKETVFIAQTGWGQEKDRALAKEAGFSHHLVKPIAVDALEKIFGSLV